MIPRQKERIRLLIEKCEGENPVERIHHGGPLFLIEMKQGLGVAPAFEVMTSSDESLAELAEVIDLSVEHNPEIPVLVGHRLGCGRRQIDDPETVMAKGYRTLLNVGAAIGPSVVLD